MALSADRLVTTKQLNLVDGQVLDLRLAASKTIYKGGLTCVLASSGLIQPCGSGTVTTEHFAGIALEQKTSGASDDIKCKILINAQFEHAVPSVAVASLGALVYATADNVLTLTPGSNLIVGRILKVYSTTTTICLIQAGAFMHSLTGGIA